MSNPLPSPTAAQRIAARKAKNLAPQENRWTAKLAQIQQGAAFGVDLEDVVAAKSDGRKDYTKEIQYSIKREYFTFKQATLVAYWASIVGLGVGAFAIMMVVPGAGWDFSLPTAGVFVLTMGLADLTSEIETYGSLKHCTKKKQKQYVAGEAQPVMKPIVDGAFQGHPCMTDWDCTKSAHLQPGQKGMCTTGAGLLIKAKRRVFTPLVVIAGIAMVSVAFTGLAERPSPKNMAYAIIYGWFAGVLMSLIFAK